MTRAFSAIFASIFLILSSAAPVAAGPFEDAREAHYKRDYATVIRLLRPLADQGNARAETILGSMYEYGEGVPKDYSEARIWLKKAADQGSSEAQFQLGFTYVNPVASVISAPLIHRRSINRTPSTSLLEFNMIDIGRISERTGRRAAKGGYFRQKTKVTGNLIYAYHFKIGKIVNEGHFSIFRRLSPYLREPCCISRYEPGYRR